MEFKEVAAIRAYARMMNTKNLHHFEPFLADDVELNSQIQSEPVHGKEKFLDHMVKTFEKIADDAPLWAEIGEIPICGRTRPSCIGTENVIYLCSASPYHHRQGQSIK